MPSENPLFQHNKYHLRNAHGKKTRKLLPAIERVTKYIYELGLDPKPRAAFRTYRPPWLFQNNSIISDLMFLPKQSTNNVVYNTYFYKTTHPLIATGWSIHYTDGSKTTSAVGYAIINSSYEIGKLIRLNEHSTIFTAETEAILDAVKWCTSQKGKHVICSDSQSCVKAIMNITHQNDSIREIRDLLIRHSNKIKIMWVPGHSGLRGNSLADQAAKFSTIAPIIQKTTQHKSDINNAIKNWYAAKKQQTWSNFHHFYKTINPSGEACTYPQQISKRDLNKYIRFRTCHTRLTHVHILTKLPPGPCPICNQGTLCIKHLTGECNRLKYYCNSYGKTMIQLLTQPSEENIHIFIKLLRILQIYYDV